MKTPFYISIGIDPGKSGCLCMIKHTKGSIVDFQFIPWSKTDNIREVYKSVEKVNDIIKESINYTICIEEVHSMPRDGGKQAFSFGKNVGMWIGMLTSLNMSYYQVTPQKWMRDLGITVKKTKEEKEKEKPAEKNKKEINCKKAYALSTKLSTGSLLDSLQSCFTGNKGGINTGNVDSFLLSIYAMTQQITASVLK